MRGDVDHDHVTNLEVRLDILHFRLGVVAQEGVHAHYYTRRAEATLRSVRLGDPLLHSVQFSPGNRNICPILKPHIRVRGLPFMTSAPKGGGGVSGKADKGRELSKGGCVNLRTRGDGGQKIRKFYGRH